jgi:hypothetical protein
MLPLNEFLYLTLKINTPLVFPKTALNKLTLNTIFPAFGPDGVVKFVIAFHPSDAKLFPPEVDDTIPYLDPGKLDVGKPPKFIGPGNLISILTFLESKLLALVFIISFVASNSPVTVMEKNCALLKAPTEGKSSLVKEKPL